jgi:hypothetical protein
LGADAVEYANRVPREIFTKDVAKSYFFEFISVVNTEGTVAAVYFVNARCLGSSSSTRL